MPERLVPAEQFYWTDDYSYHRRMICPEHKVIFSTKNPWHRSLFTISGEDCLCPIHKLMVIVHETENDE